LGFFRVATCVSVTPTTPILVSKKVAAGLLGISIGMLDKLVRQGRIEPVHLGRRVLFRRDAIEELTLTERQRRALRIDTAGTVQ
jgi:excisionase family DNA binding protein